MQSAGSGSGWFVFTADGNGSELSFQSRDGRVTTCVVMMFGNNGSRRFRVMCQSRPPCNVVALGF